MYQIVITKQAAKSLKKLNLTASQKKLIFKAIDSLKTDPLLKGFALRKDLQGFYKLRVGPFRIIYDVQRKKIKVVIIAIGNRKDVYQKIKRKI